MGIHRTVKFMSNQSAEDLYFCIDEGNRGKVYCRQPCAGNRHVRWLTTSKWSGGFEADSPLREGITIQVVDDNGEILFTESTERVEGYEGSIAERRGMFSYEAIKAVTSKVSEEMHLLSYSDWKHWLLSNKRDTSLLHKTFSNEEWLWINSTVMRKEIVERDRLITGQEYILLHTWHRHTVCNVTWEEYKLCPADESSVFEICGYHWSSNAPAFV